MTAIWIGLSVAGVLGLIRVLVWRLRRAAALLDRILLEEGAAEVARARHTSVTPKECG